jgi:hypothetical protein
LALAELLEQALTAETARILYLVHLAQQAVVVAERFITQLILVDQAVELVVVDLVQPLEHFYKELKVAAQEVVLELRQIVEAAVVAHITWVLMAQEVELLDMVFLHQLLVLQLLMAAVVAEAVM